MVNPHVPEMTEPSMSEPETRLATLLELRDELLARMAEADLEFSRLRMDIERIESDLRIGREEPPGYQEAKGVRLPQAEARVLECFRQLLKLEDKINLCRAGGTD